jgi:hypothetical protein
MHDYITEFNRIVSEGAALPQANALSADDLIHFFVAGLKREGGKNVVGQRIAANMSVHRTQHELRQGREPSLEEVQQFATFEFKNQGLSDRPADETKGERKASASVARGQQKSRGKDKRSTPYKREDRQSKGKDPVGVACFACKQRGHLVRDCPLVRAVQDSQHKGKVAEVTQASARKDFR